MKIDRETIRHLERLAHVQLTDDEAEKISEQLTRIVGFCETLQSVNTDGVEPTRLMSSGNEEHVRDDVVVPGLDRETVLNNAPERTEEYIRVPRVLGKGDA